MKKKVKKPSDRLKLVSELANDERNRQVQ